MSFVIWCSRRLWSRVVFEPHDPAVVRPSLDDAWVGVLASRTEHLRGDRIGCPLVHSSFVSGGMGSTVLWQARCGVGPDDCVRSRGHWGQRQRASRCCAAAGGCRNASAVCSTPRSARLARCEAVAYARRRPSQPFHLSRDCLCLPKDALSRRQPHQREFSGEACSWPLAFRQDRRPPKHLRRSPNAGAMRWDEAAALPSAQSLSRGCITVGYGSVAREAKEDGREPAYGRSEDRGYRPR